LKAGQRVWVLPKNRPAKVYPFEERRGRYLVGLILEEKGVESLSPEYLVRTFGLGSRPVALAEVLTALTGSPGQPVLVDPQRGVRQAIREGVEQGKFGVSVGGRTYIESLDEEILSRPDLTLPSPGRRPEGQSPRPNPGPDAPKSYPPRKALEQLQGQDLTLTGPGGQTGRAGAAA